MADHVFSNIVSYYNRSENGESYLQIFDEDLGQSKERNIVELNGKKNQRNIYSNSDMVRLLDLYTLG